MSVIIEATYQNGAFKSAQPVSLPEGTKVRFVITPAEDISPLRGPDRPAAEASEQGRSAPAFVWTKTIYRARKAAQEFAQETHAGY
jgi:predicted DNA-binding antitoxin AbrB/MazE fold protein